MQPRTRAAVNTGRFQVRRPYSTNVHRDTLDNAQERPLNFGYGGSMPPCRLRRRKFSKIWLRNGAFWSTEKCSFSHVIAFLIFHPFFQGVSWPHLPLCADAHDNTADHRWPIVYNVCQVCSRHLAERTVCHTVAQAGFLVTFSKQFPALFSDTSE